MKKSDDLLITINVGRGGRFYNGGHKSLIDSGKSIKDYIDDHLFFDEEKNILYDGAENKLDFEFNENGTGYINIDNQYNTVIVSLLSDLNPEEYYLIGDSDVWNAVELLELVGVKNAKILEKFNLLSKACNDQLFDLEDYFIQEVSKETWEESNYGFEDYEDHQIGDQYYVREL